MNFPLVEHFYALNFFPRWIRGLACIMPRFVCLRLAVDNRNSDTIYRSGVSKVRSDLKLLIFLTNQLCFRIFSINRGRELIRIAGNSNFNCILDVFVWSSRQMYTRVFPPFFRAPCRLLYIMLAFVPTF